MATMTVGGKQIETRYFIHRDPETGKPVDTYVLTKCPGEDRGTYSATLRKLEYDGTLGKPLLSKKVSFEEKRIGNLKFSTKYITRAGQNSYSHVPHSRTGGDFYVSSGESVLSGIQGNTTRISKLTSFDLWKDTDGVINLSMSTFKKSPIFKRYMKLIGKSL